MSNYAKKALQYALAAEGDFPECAPLAQAFATLAVAEQLRIANLIALGVDASTRGETWGRDILYRVKRLPEPGAMMLTLRPDIAASLGLAVGDE